MVLHAVTQSTKRFITNAVGADPRIRPCFETIKQTTNHTNVLIRIMFYRS